MNYDAKSMKLNRSSLGPSKQALHLAFDGEVAQVPLVSERLQSGWRRRERPADVLTKAKTFSAVDTTYRARAADPSEYWRTRAGWPSSRPARISVQPGPVVRTGSVMLSSGQSLLRQPKKTPAGSLYPEKCRAVLEVHRQREKTSFSLTRDQELVEAAHPAEAVGIARNPYPARMFAALRSGVETMPPPSRGPGLPSHSHAGPLKQGQRAPGIPTAMMRNVAGLLATAPTPYPPREELEEHFGTGAMVKLRNVEGGEEDLGDREGGGGGDGGWRVEADRSQFGKGEGGLHGNGGEVESGVGAVATSPLVIASRPGGSSGDIQLEDGTDSWQLGSRDTHEKSGSQIFNGSLDTRSRSRQQPAVPRVGYHTAFSELISTEGPDMPKTPGKGLSFASTVLAAMSEMPVKTSVKAKKRAD